MEDPLQNHPEVATLIQAGIDPNAAKGMVLKKAVYRTLQGDDLVVEYDCNASCRMCGLPVVEASVGGTDVCPWCDMGCDRNGRKWTMMEMLKKTEPKTAIGVNTGKGQ